MKSMIHEHKKNNFKMVSKKLIVMALLVFGLTAFAQEKESKRPRGEKFESLTKEQKVEFQVKKMTKDLNLNESQIKEVKAITVLEVEKREKIIGEMKELKEQNRKKMKEEKVALEIQMKKILSPEQFEKWQKISDNRKTILKEKIAERRGKGKIKELPEAK